MFHQIRVNPKSVKQFLVVPLVLLAVACGPPRSISLVNYSHLDGLMESFLRETIQA